MNGYELSKIWYQWCCNNNDVVNPNHHALYFWCIEKCNRLDWPQSYSLPTDEAMHHLGIGSYKTYIKALEELISFGFIKMLQRSKNQYTANVIALVKNTEAMPKHLPKQVQSNYQSDAKALTKAVPKQSDHNKTFKNIENLETKKENDVKEKFSSSLIKVVDVVENEIPDFVKQEQKKIREQITTPAPPLEEIEANMRNSQLLKESAKRKNKISENEYYQLLEDFFIETRATDKKTISESDHKRHFLSWVRIQVEHLNKNGGSPPKGKIQSAYEDMSNVLNELNNQEQ